MDSKFANNDFEPGLVSTVITSFNKGDFLAEAISSAVNQDIANHQVIVVDDGSTDNTRQVAERFLDDITFFHQENRGQVAAKNKGIELSRGEYIAFLDGDDRWLPGKLKKQVARFEANDAIGVVYTDRLKFEGEKIVVPSNKVHHQPCEGVVTNDMLHDNFVPFSSSMVRKSFLDQAGWLSESCPIGPDYDLWLRMSLVCEFAFVDEVLLEYRVGIDSIGSRTKSKLAHTIRIQEQFIEKYFDGKFPNQSAVAKAYFRKYMSRGNQCLGEGNSLEAYRAFWNAAKNRPFDWRAYRGFLRTLLGKRIASLFRRGHAASTKHGI